MGDDDDDDDDDDELMRVQLFVGILMGFYGSFWFSFNHNLIDIHSFQTPFVAQGRNLNVQWTKVVKLRQQNWYL